MIRITVIVVVLFMIGCNKDNSCVDGVYRLDKIVNNRTGEIYIYPEDSFHVYNISGGVARVSLRYNGADSFMYNIDMDCNKVFYNIGSSFQLGFPFLYNVMVKI